MAPKRTHPDRRGKPTRITTQLKADVYFEIYYALGAERSLDALKKKLTDLDMPRVARTTLADWSVKYDWQGRLAQRARLERAARDRAVQDEVERMNERQSFLGAVMQNISAQALQGYRDGKGDLTRDLDPQAVVALAREGSRMERLARGEATDREAIVVETWSLVIREFAALFQRINTLGDAEIRAHEFADGVDSIGEKHVALLAARRA